MSIPLVVSAQSRALSPLHILLYGGACCKDPGLTGRSGNLKGKRKNVRGQELCVNWRCATELRRNISMVLGVDIYFQWDTTWSLMGVMGYGWVLIVREVVTQNISKIRQCYRERRQTSCSSRQTNTRKTGAAHQPCPRATSMCFACWGLWFAQSFQVPGSRH